MIIYAYGSFVNMFYVFFLTMVSFFDIIFKEGGDNTNLRLKELRKFIGISQEEMGVRLGVTGTAISRLEKGERKITEQMILSIIREFNVNDEWFRTGVGEIFVEIAEEDEYIAAASEISKNKDEFAMQAIIDYWKLDNDSKQLLKDYIFGIVDNIRKKE